MPEHRHISASSPSEGHAFRIGHGYDLHRLDPSPPHGGKRAFLIGGIEFDSDRIPVGHSDADALLHAITDAVLGALALPDIGQLFSDQDPANAGRDSCDFLARAVELMLERGFAVGNLDATVILERPRIGPRKTEIIANVASLLGVDPGRVNIKGKTHEKVDAVGEGRAIEVHCVVLLMPKA